MTWFSSYIDDDTAEVLDVRLAEGDEEDAILDYSINVNVASHPLDGFLFSFEISAQLDDYAGIDRIETSVEISSNYTVDDDYLIFNVPVTLTPNGGFGEFSGNAYAPAELFDSIPNPDDVGSYGLSLAGTTAIKSMDPAVIYS